MFYTNSYTEAVSLAQAIELLSGNPNAQIIAGGTDVLIKAREHKEHYIQKDWVGITRIPELKTIALDGKGNLLIGAACSFTTVENNELVKKHVPLLAFAVGTVGGPQIRNMGTIGGNICNGATSADSAATLFALQAKIVISGKDGSREVPIESFYAGPGRVNLVQGEIATQIKIDKADYEGFRGHYIKFCHRNAMDIANLGCSVSIKVNGDIIDDLRIAFGVAGPIPLRAVEAEQFAKGKKVSDDVLKEIGALCLKNTKARDSWRASKAFREQLIQELPQRAIKTALEGK